MSANNLRFLFGVGVLVALPVTLPAKGRLPDAPPRAALSSPLPPPAEPAPVAAPAPAPAAPEREIVTASLEFHGKALVIDLPLDGRVDEATADRLADYLRFWRNGRTHRLAPGLIAMLADLAARYPGHTIEIVSGVRTPPYGAKHSKHFTGQALDLRVRGVKLTEVRDYVWTRHRNIGVGYYPYKGFIHMDHRPGHADTAWTARSEGADNYRYHPSWSIRARARARR